MSFKWQDRKSPIDMWFWSLLSLTDPSSRSNTWKCLLLDIQASIAWERKPNSNMLFCLVKARSVKPTTNAQVLILKKMLIERLYRTVESRVEMNWLSRKVVLSDLGFDGSEIKGRFYFSCSNLCATSFFLVIHIMQVGACNKSFQVRMLRFWLLERK